MSLFRILFPRTCVNCNQTISASADENLCNRCWQLLTPPVIKCIFCDTYDSFLCHLCKKEYPFLKNIHVCFRYEEVAKKLIQQYKFSLKPYLAQTIARLMWQESLDFFAELPLSTEIIPMPSGRLRMAKRGFNPIGLVAKKLSQRSDLLYNATYLQKRAFSIAQTQLSREERLSNHQQSFYLNNKAHSYKENRSILLVDDVVTTGTSFRKAIETLNNPHTKQIFGLFIAQT